MVKCPKCGKTNSVVIGRTGSPGSECRNEGLEWHCNSCDTDYYD